MTGVCGAPRITTSTWSFHTGQRTELVDVDELLEALQMGLLSPETAEQAIHCAVAAIDGLAAHDHDLAGLAGQ